MGGEGLFVLANRFVLNKCDTCYIKPYEVK